MPAEPGHVELLPNTQGLVSVVPIDAYSPGRLRGYFVGTVREIYDYALPGVVSAATIVNDSLYLAIAGKLYIADQDHPSVRFVAPLPGYVSGGLVADPRRSRLLYLMPVGQTDLVRSFDLDGGPAITTALPIESADLAVVDGTIFAAGFGATSAALFRLDPSSLHPGRNLADETTYGPGVIIAGTGDYSLYVRDANTKLALRCLDASTGRERAHWPSLPGLVVSTRGHAYVAEPHKTIRKLDLGRCRG